MKFTVIIWKGEKQYVVLCPEVDVVSQCYSVGEAIQNLKEAVELNLEVMGLPEGVNKEEPLVTSIGVAYGKQAFKTLW